MKTVGIGFCTLLLGGCITTRPPSHSQAFNLRPVTIVVAPQAEVDEVARSHGVTDRLRGLTLTDLDIVVVRWSDAAAGRGVQEPDFEALGHEIWHCLKGRFHD